MRAAGKPRRCGKAVCGRALAYQDWMPRWSRTASCTPTLTASSTRRREATESIAEVLRLLKRRAETQQSLHPNSSSGVLEERELLLIRNRLARLEITGGTIRDIATRAALRAAAQATPITMPLILEIAAAEVQKLGPTPDAEDA
jgi:hypothetical protein